MESEKPNPARHPLVAYRADTPSQSCPYGHVQRIVTAGAGGIANVHVVTVSEGGLHLHQAYDETYYVLAGHGTITLDGEPHELRPGAVIVIPAGVAHALQAAGDEPLEFIIFGTPPMSIDDPRACPRRPGE